jgi:hypothetical protein
LKWALKESATIKPVVKIAKALDAIFSRQRGLSLARFGQA